MVAAEFAVFDPLATYYRPDQLIMERIELSLTKPASGSFGLSLQAHGKDPGVKSVTPRSAAELGGLIAGDTIVDINGTDVTGYGIAKAVKGVKEARGDFTIVVMRRAAGGSKGVSIAPSHTATQTPASVMPATTTDIPKPAAEVLPPPPPQLMSETAPVEDHTNDGVAATSGDTEHHSKAEDDTAPDVPASPPPPDDDVPPEIPATPPPDDDAPPEIPAGPLPDDDDDASGNGNGDKAGYDTAAAHGADTSAVNTPMTCPFTPTDTSSECAPPVAVAAGAPSSVTAPAPDTSTMAPQEPLTAATPDTAAVVNKTPADTTEPPAPMPPVTTAPVAPQTALVPPEASAKLITNERKAAAVNALADNLANVTRGIKLVKGDQKVNLKTRVCGACGKTITDGKFVQAMGQTFHPQCFTCEFCNKPLGGQFLVEDGKRTCRACAEANAGVCHRCGKSVMSDDVTERMRVIHMGDRVYHPECFTCSRCFVALKEPYLVNGCLVCKDHRGGNQLTTSRGKGGTFFSRLQQQMGTD